MTNITINIPDDKYKYLEGDSVFQSVITETVFDYIEKKQDLETKKSLSQNKEFKFINDEIEKKLGK